MSFPDVPAERWSAKDIDRAVASGLMSGYTDGLFWPASGVTREQLAAVLARLTFRLCVLDGLMPSILPAVCTILSKNSKGTSLGTGFYVSADGYLMTAKHVIEDGTSFSLVDDGQANKTAKLIAVNDQHDFALLKADTPAPVYLKIAPDDAIYSGKHIAVIGSPRGYNDSVTQGVVSHSKREHDIASTAMDCAQTDAAINEGNSGGPIIDGNGAVIGLADWKIKLLAVEGMAFFVRCEFIRQFLAENGIRA